MDLDLLKLEEFNDSYFGDYSLPSYTPGISSDVSMKITVMITAWILTTNLLFVATILLSRSLRSKPSSWLMLNLSCANTCVGIIVTPLAAYYEHSDFWKLGTSACIAWLFCDVFLSCVSILSLLMINLDRFIFIRKPFSYDGDFRKPTVFVMIALSWLGAATLVVPLFFVGHKDGFETDIPNMCYMEISPAYAIGIAVASYFIPAFTIIVLTGAIVVAVASTKRRLQDVPMVTHINGRAHYVTRGTCAKIKAIATVLVILNGLYVAMFFPFFLFSTIMGAGGFTLISPTAIVVSIWLCYVNSGLNPVLWLIHPEVRRAFGQILCCMCCRRNTVCDTDSKDSSEQTFMLNTATY